MFSDSLVLSEKNYSFLNISNIFFSKSQKPLAVRVISISLGCFHMFLSAFEICFCWSTEILTVESKTKWKYSFLLFYLLVSCNVILVYVLIPIWNKQIKFNKKSIKEYLRRCKCLFANRSRRQHVLHVFIWWNSYTAISWSETKVYWQSTFPDSHFSQVFLVKNPYKYFLLEPATQCTRNLKWRLINLLSLRP